MMMAIIILLSKTQRSMNVNTPYKVGKKGSSSKGVLH